MLLNVLRSAATIVDSASFAGIRTLSLTPVPALLRHRRRAVSLASDDERHITTTTMTGPWFGHMRAWLVGDEPKGSYGHFGPRPMPVASSHQLCGPSL